MTRLALLLAAAAALPVPALAAGPVALSGPGGTASLSEAALRALPQMTLDLPGEHGGPLHLAGPALWPLLLQSGVIDANVHHHAREALTATGQDGYTAVIALGELDPALEGKAAILALDQDGKPLPAPRLALPGDKHLARDVRDVASLAVR